MFTGSGLDNGIFDAMPAASTIHRKPLSHSRIKLDASSLDFENKHTLFGMSDNKVRLTIPHTSFRPTEPMHPIKNDEWVGQGAQGIIDSTLCLTAGIIQYPLRKVFRKHTRHAGSIAINKKYFKKPLSGQRHFNIAT